MEIPKFEFKKFKPSRAVVQKAEAVLLHLIDFIPTDAAVFLSFSRLKDKYNCLIQVKAHGTQFVQAITGDDLTSSMDRVAEKIKDEILNWKVGNLVMVEPTFWNFKEIN